MMPSTYNIPLLLFIYLGIIAISLCCIAALRYFPLKILSDNAEMSKFEYLSDCQRCLHYNVAVCG